MNPSGMHSGMRLAAGFVVLLAACGGGENTEATSPTTSTPPPAATTTVAPTTTATPPTTVAPTTTTTAASTTTTTSTTTLPPSTTTSTTKAPFAGALSAELGSAVERAAEFFPCVARTGATGVILSDLEGDLGVDQMASLGFFNGRVVVTGLLLSAQFPMVTTRDDALATLQAKLYMNGVRGSITFGIFRGAPFAMGVARGDTFSPGSVAEWQDLVFAIWEGEDLEIVGESRTEFLPFDWRSLVRPPLPQLAVGRDTRAEGWGLVDGWVTDLEGATETWRFGDWTAAANLESLVPRLVDIEALLCVLLGTEFDIVENLRAPSGDDFFRELAIQEAFLILEYVHVLADHMSQPDIDWLRGPGVEASQDPFDETTDTSEFIVFWLDGLTQSLSIYRQLTSDNPLEGGG